ncbi:rod shape-determining protein RodA [bacterium endosymbiont of Escarpia laminata]|nr:MAG: rod shape-determining protein RodA [bacterium endosymbiont of Escarpia laminata]
MIKKRLVSAITPVLAMALLLATPISGAHSPPEEAKVYFVDLEDGEVVKSPFKVKFGIKGFGITPAGTKGKRRHTAGHHHLLVDVEQLPDMDEAIPRDPHHIHFDRGETGVMLKLPSGRHTLQLLLGDEQHEPQDPPLISEKITITVN